ncbi:6740_t:CDS:1, partial [Funneliformis geosporum]
MSASSTSAPMAPIASLPTVEEINGWNRDRAKGFLQERRADLDLEGKDIDKMYNQK